MYTIYFLKIPPGEANPVRYARVNLGFDDVEVDDDTENDSNIDHSRLVSRLQQMFPGMERCDDEEAGEIELRLTDDAGEFAFYLYPDGGAALMVHYEGANAVALWSKLWPAVGSLQFHFGFSAYDEQLNRILDPTRDQNEVLECFQQ